MLHLHKGNLFEDIDEQGRAERFETLLAAQGFRLERIVSTGQATPDGEWFDQDRDEWVVLLSGGAGLQFEGESESRVLRPGDHVLIPARSRHRVQWTIQGSRTVWLAIHFDRSEPVSNTARFPQIS